MKIIDYFDNDKQWEHAIPLCKGAAFWREIVLQKFLILVMINLSANFVNVSWKFWNSFQLNIHVKAVTNIYCNCNVLYFSPSIFWWLEFQNFWAQTWHFKLTHYFFQLNQNVTTDSYWIYTFCTSNCCRNDFIFKMCKSNDNLWNIMV